MERIFAHKQAPDGTQKLLVKWEGLPYAEATFETLQDVIKVGGQKDILEYQVPIQLDSGLHVFGDLSCMWAANL